MRPGGMSEGREMMRLYEREQRVSGSKEEVKRE